MSDNEGKNMGLTSKIQIPYFDPASNKIGPEAWIAYVDLARESAGTKTVTEEGAQFNLIGLMPKLVQMQCYFCRALPISGACTY